MPRRVVNGAFNGQTPRPLAGPPYAPASPGAAPELDTRIDHLVALVDHCKAAQDLSDALGDKFLSYLLAMTIQEAQGAMRRSNLQSRQ